jgi:hypothetical protein
MGLIMALLLGLALVAGVAFYVLAQTGWVGNRAGAGQTNVNVTTTNAPPAVAPSGAR